MATCPGTNDKGNFCGDTVYRCKECQSVGCRRSGCPNENFEGGGRCKSCGKSSGKDPI